VARRGSGSGRRRQDVPFPTVVPCGATADTTVGSTCAIATSVNAQAPRAIPGHKRTIVELGAVNVYDGGSDGDPNVGPEGTLFMDEGIFIP